MHVLLCTTVGMIMGFMFAFLHFLFHMAAGGIETHDGSIMRLPDAMVTFVIGMALGGTIVGVLGLLPLSRSSRSIAAVAGVLWMFPMMSGVSVLYYGSWADTDWSLVVIGSILVGIPIGQTLRSEYIKFTADHVA
jgi:hypothetical protein